MNIKEQVALKKAIMEQELTTPDKVKGGISRSYVDTTSDSYSRTEFEARSKFRKTIGSGSSYVSDGKINKYRQL